MLKLEKAKELDYNDGKRVLVYKNGVSIGAIRIIDDDRIWQFRISTDKDLIQGQSLVDLTGEELKQLSEVALSHELPK